MRRTVKDIVLSTSVRKSVSRLSSALIFFSVVGISLAIWWRPLTSALVLDLRDGQSTHILLILPVSAALIFLNWKSPETSTVRCTVEFNSWVWPAICRTLQWGAAFWFCLQCLAHQLSPSFIADANGLGATRHAVPLPLLHEASPPFAHSGVGQSQLPGNLLVHLSRRTQQNNARSKGAKRNRHPA